MQLRHVGRQGLPRRRRGVVRAQVGARRVDHAIVGRTRLGSGVRDAEGASGHRNHYQQAQPRVLGPLTPQAAAGECQGRTFPRHQPGDWTNEPQRGGRKRPRSRSRAGRRTPRATEHLRRCRVGPQRRTRVRSSQSARLLRLLGMICILIGGESG